VSLDLAGEEVTDREAAVMCASHNGEPVHLQAVGSLLDRAGLGLDALKTPPARPLDPESAALAPEPRPEFHNCSGKHAGMLLACVRRGLDPRSYLDPDHHLQETVLEVIRRAAGRDPVSIGVDGCGVPVHALPLASMATLYARLARGVSGGERVLAAMRAEPYLVAGRDRVCTAVMESAPGVAVKTGAEGMMCAALPDRGLGLALKVEDGAARAADLAVVHALALLEAVDPEAMPRFSRPPVLGGGRPVGHLEAVFTLDPA
jgi:L-asparaginase II